MTESKEDFDALQAGLVHEILPRNIVEHIYVADIAAITWEILRLRRCKAVIIDAAFYEALTGLLKRHFGIFGDEDAKALAQEWFTEVKAKKQVAEILREVRLDEFAIEAEAVRLSLSDLEVLDRMLSALESRRNKAFRCIEDYRVGFAKQVKDSSNRALERSEVLSIDHRPSKKSA